MVGVGAVGSQVATELARAGVGRLLFVDGDVLEPSNLFRHALPKRFVGHNKAEGLACYIAEEVPGANTRGWATCIDRSVSNTDLDVQLYNAHLVVAATDDRIAQRRISERALAMGIPAIFPAVYEQGGGEVFAQIDRELPCFSCWDAHRTTAERLRAVLALNVDTLAVIQLCVYLAIGILDSDSESRRLMAPRGDDPRPPQLFVWRQFGAGLSMATVERRPDCLSCARLQNTRRASSTGAGVFGAAIQITPYGGTP